MAAWKMVRTPGKFSKILFVIFVSAMVIPFQTVMIPLMKVGGTLGLTNSIPGLIIMYFGFGVPLSLFLYHGFVKTVPIEIEESAMIDGCSQFGVFWRIVFPLLKPITVTVIILNTLWIWNDYLLPTPCFTGCGTAYDSTCGKLVLCTVYEAMGYGPCSIGAWYNTSHHLLPIFTEAYHQRDCFRFDQVDIKFLSRWSIIDTEIYIKYFISGRSIHL